MSYIHLTIEERTSIAYLHNKGVSLRQIAKAIGRNVSTIKREFIHQKSPPKEKVIFVEENKPLIVSRLH